MNNLYKNTKLGGTALVVLLASSFATAYGQGNNEPSGQAGGTGTSNVVVTNSPAQPLPVKEQNNPAFQPYQWQGQTLRFCLQQLHHHSLRGTAGKRLVIEEMAPKCTFQVRSRAKCGGSF